MLPLHKRNISLCSFFPSSPILVQCGVGPDCGHPGYPWCWPSPLNCISGIWTEVGTPLLYVGPWWLACPPQHALLSCGFWGALCSADLFSIVAQGDCIAQRAHTLLTRTHAPLHPLQAPCLPLFLSLSLCLCRAVLEGLFCWQSTLHACHLCYQRPVWPECGPKGTGFLSEWRQSKINVMPCMCACSVVSDSLWPHRL